MDKLKAQIIVGSLAAVSSSFTGEVTVHRTDRPRIAYFSPEGEDMESSTDAASMIEYMDQDKLTFLVDQHYQITGESLNVDELWESLPWENGLG